MNCPVCAHAEHQRLVTRVKTPVFQNAVHSTAENARSAESGDLSFEACTFCGFVWNSAFDSSRIRYAEGYDNSQVHSAAFIDHLNSRVARILSTLPPDGPVTIVEIGCGQGDFLTRLNAALPKGRAMRAVGFDPAYRGGASNSNEIEIYAEYFTAENAARLSVAPDIVVSRHTIEHVPDPVGFLSAIRATLPTGKPARLFLETPDTTWIFRHRAFQDFFYEHCSLFDFSSMTFALRRAGLVASMIEACFAGQYLWVEAAAAPEAADLQIATFVSSAAGFVTTWRETLLRAGKRGPVALWGAGAKGATFALMTDPDRQLIDAVVDSNPGKAGGFIAVSAHPIIPPGKLAERGVRTIIVMNPNYEAEIRTALHSLNLNPEIIVLR